MVRILQLSEMTEQEEDLLKDHLLMLKDKGYTREEFDYRRWQMDLALKQQFIDQAVASGSYADYNLDSEQISSLTGEDFDTETNDIGRDWASDLYLPLLLKFFRAYLVNMSNLNFPANGDWLSINREFSQYFYDTGIEKFLPFVNEAWVNIIKTENQRFNTKEVYKTAMAEDISYGNTVVGHGYNPTLHYLEPFTPGIGSAAIWPIHNDWRKSNLMFYYDVNFARALAREDLDQEVLMQLKPEVTDDDAQALAGYGSTGMKEHRESQSPFGTLRFYDFFCPSIYIEDGDNEPFVVQNAYFVTAIKPSLQKNATLDKDNLFILKARQDVSEVDHGLLFASFGTNLPSVFYQQGPLQPFLPHQYTANQFISEISRSVALANDPPKSITAVNGGMLDPSETPIPDFETGANYENMEVKPLIDPTSIANSMNVFLNYMNYLDRNLEDGVGVSKAQLGTMHLGKKTATEIKESYSGSQLNMVEAAARYDEQILRPSIATRISGQQKILRDQIEKSARETAEESQGLLNSEVLYDMLLQQNPLFNRLLNYSGIEEQYRDFYKKTMNEFLDDQALLNEVQMMAQQIASLIQFADSPIPPAPEVPQGEMINPETGESMVIPTVDEIQQLKAAYFQEEQVKRDQARQQAKQLEIEIKRKQLMFEDIKEPPPPTKKLFYEMLTAFINNSDVIVTGSMTTVSKSLARENLMDMLNALTKFPPEVLQKIDYDSVLALLSRANDLPLKDLKKSEAKILREEQKQEMEALFQQQLQMQASQGTPGAQPPQFG